MIQDRPEEELPSELLEEVLRVADLEDSLRSAAEANLVLRHPSYVTPIREFLARSVTTSGETQAAIPFRSGTTPPQAADQPSIPSFRIVRTLGAGAQGTVYLAEQIEPVRRQVALKVIRGHADRAAFLRRFAMERQALAVMNHENIARIYEFGSTDQGDPYCALEYVPGLPLDQYCDQHRLDLVSRIRLFQRICSGVQHAHTKGVIHRDLKPGNILVHEVDGSAIPKIIDFGLARATEQAGFASFALSEARMIVGTVDYMSPEQARPGETPPDTRTDIYSLGALLYQLLSGCLPLEAAAQRRNDLVALLKMICEQEPERPSARIDRLGPKARPIAEARQSTVSSLRSALQSELDWIALKCLEKDPDRRYPTADALHSDLQRFLDHQPIEAHAPSWALRFRKAFRRNRAAVLFASVICAIIALAALATAILYSRLVDEQRRLEFTTEEFAEKTGLLRLDAALEAGRRYESLRPGRENARDLRAWIDEKAAPIEALREILQRSTRRTLTTLAPEAPVLSAFVQQMKALREWTDARRRALRFRATMVAKPGYQIAPAMPGHASLEVRFLPSHTQELQSHATAKEHDPSSPPLEFLATLNVPSTWTPSTANLLLPLPTREAPSFRAQRAETEIQLTLFDLPSYGWCLVDLGAAIRPGTELQIRMTLPEPGADSSSPQLGRLFSASAEQLLSVLEQQELQRLLARTHALQPDPAVPRSFRSPENASLHPFLAIWELLLRIETELVPLREKLEREISFLSQAEELLRSRDRSAWTESQSALQKAVYVDASPYSTRHSPFHPIQLRPLVGLVPLGPNPKTGLLEFYDLRSAWDDTTPLRELPLPQQDPEGRIAVSPATGIVYVLVPGACLADSLINVRPFFLARHELTLGQWDRLSGAAAPSLENYDPTSRLDALPQSHAHPVTGFSPSEVERFLETFSLSLPTWDQWRRANGAATVHEPELASFSSPGPKEANLSGDADAWRGLAPVGLMSANRLGMHDLLGNASEILRSDGGGAGSERTAEGNPQPRSAREVVLAGGRFSTALGDLPQWLPYRREITATLSQPNAGLRVAFDLVRD